MKTLFQARLADLKDRMCEREIDTALVTDDDNIFYLTGYYDYLHMDFGRPTIFVVHQHGPSLLITPQIDENSARSLAHCDEIFSWNDGMGDEWREKLPDLINLSKKIGIEVDRIPQIVLSYLSSLNSTEKFVNFSEILEEMRMIKSPEELQVARHAGQVANAMMKAGREAIIDGRPEFEVAIATSAAGTRSAAELLEKQYPSTDMSPNTHFLQIMASGEDIVKTHHRASTRIMRNGDPVFLCFCGMTNFYKFKLGFDRTFWINSAKPEHIKVYETALSSQEAALSVLGPGVKAEQVHEAYAEVIKDAGYDYPFRCGRATGYSFLEKPFLIKGDKTILRPGMVFAVDGSVLTNDFRAQVGDSFIITETGYEQITNHPKTVDEIII